MIRYLAPIACIGLAACSPQQIQEANTYQAQIAAACGTAMAVGAADPAIGVYIVAGCATEQAIAKLALDPNSLSWVQGLIANAKGGS